jgi:TPR repeat protein
MTLRGILIALALTLGLSCVARAEPRVALVIGNDRYPNLPPNEQLQRAVADAAAVGRKLTAMGFKVIALANADRRQIDQAIDQVAASLDPGGSVVVYFAGHGVDIGGGAYLIPVDAPAPDQASPRLLEKEAVALESLFEDLAPLRAKTNVIILDACRDNPYRDPTGRAMGGERGLERPNPPQSFFVLYSAGQNQVAQDRLPRGDQDPNSLYTRVLLRHLDDPVSLIDLAKRVQAEVATMAAGAGLSQVPAYYDQIIGSPSITGQLASARPPSPPPPDPGAVEAGDWRSSHCANGDRDGCRAYLGKYGQGGLFGDLAALKLRPTIDPPPAAAPDANAAARAAVDGVSEADWRGKVGADLLSQALTRVTFAQIEALAETGDARAQSLVGEALYLGTGGQAQDYAQAAVWYRKAADQGDFRAENNLGALYADGQGVMRDYAQALSWYRKAADQGSPVAQNNLGNLYDAGQGVTQDYGQALAWYRKAADQGNSVAQTNIGAMYENGQGVTQDYAQAMAWYRKAADQGLADAQNNVGDLYQNGQGVARDFAQAMTWYRKAADQGLAEAQFNVGVLYHSGAGVTKDDVEALAWYRKAAAQGNALAEVNIGLFYRDGLGVGKDYAQAMARYRKAADQNLPAAQFAIGVLYHNGQGVTQDYAQAMAWYRKAADQGSDNAENNIGALYEDGNGVAQDYGQALAWYRKAADQGNAVAQRNVGRYYENGFGVGKDMTQARIWYAKAAARGDDVAKQWLATHAG